jgi:hypothetical protein
MPSSSDADAQQIFRGRVERLDQQAAIGDDDAGVQVVDDVVDPQRLMATARPAAGKL